AALLLALGESQGEAGVTELARRLGLHKSTASRLLATLQKRGLVEQDDETGKYRLGLVIIRLAERAELTLDLRGIAMPEPERRAPSRRRATPWRRTAGATAASRCCAGAPVLSCGRGWQRSVRPLSNWRPSVTSPPTSPSAPVAACTLPGASAHTTGSTTSLRG